MLLHILHICDTIYFMKQVAAAVALTMASLTACGGESGPFDSAQKWERNLPEVEAIADDAKHIDSFTIGDHEFHLGSLDKTAFPLTPKKALFAAQVILKSAADHPSYTAFANDKNNKLISEDLVNVNVHQSAQKEHLFFAATSPSRFASLASLKHTANAFTLKTTNRADVPTLTFLASERYQENGFKTYHKSDVSTFSGTQVAEICQTLIDAEPDLGVGREERISAIIGNELYCNSVARAIAFAMDNEPYDNYVADIQVTPLELAKREFGINIPYRRATPESYAAIASGTVGGISFVEPEHN